MLHRLSFALSLAAILSLAACDNPSTGKPTATVGSQTTATATSSLSGETLPLQAGTSTVGFVGSKLTGSHTGQFTSFRGNIVLAEGKAEGGKVTVNIDMASVKTDTEKLDGHLKSPDFFDVAKYPNATFVSTEVRKGAEKGTHTLVGNFTLHGVTKSISFPANITVAPDQVTATSEFVINRKDFGIVYAGKADDLIRDEVVINLSLKVPRKKS